MYLNKIKKQCKSFDLISVNRKIYVFALWFIIKFFFFWATILKFAKKLVALDSQNPPNHFKSWLVFYNISPSFWVISQVAWVILSCRMTNEICKRREKKKWNSWSGFWICHCWVFSKNKNKMKTIMIENLLANTVSREENNRKQVLKTISQNAFCWCLKRLQWEG